MTPDLRNVAHPASYQTVLGATVAPPPQAAAAVELADVLRKVMRATVGSSAPDEVLSEATHQARQLLDLLGPHAEESRAPQGRRFGESMFFVNHPMVGPANPSAPPLRLHIDGETLTATVVYGTAQEGPEGCAYGGWIAASFDAILLMAAGLKGGGGPTRSLTVTYKRPTPLNTELTLRATVESMEERRTIIVGQLMHGDTVCAEGRADVARAKPASA
jgi:acyl-coenzyme A thioesterase PaaI-like protein